MEFQSVVGAAKERSFRERDSEQNRLDSLRDGYYTKTFNADNSYLISTTEASVSGLPVIVFSPSATDTVRWSFFKPKYWRNGEMRIDIYWGTSGTLTGNMEVDLAVYGFENDAVMSGAGGRTTLHSSTFQLTPSGTAFYLQKHSVNITTSLVDDMVFCSGYMLRDGVTDSNNDNWQVAGYVFEFLPNHRQ